MAQAARSPVLAGIYPDKIRAIYVASQVWADYCSSLFWPRPKFRLPRYPPPRVAQPPRCHSFNLACAELGFVSPLRLLSAGSVCASPSRCRRPRRSSPRSFDTGRFDGQRQNRRRQLARWGVNWEPRAEQLAKAPQPRPVRVRAVRAHRHFRRSIRRASGCGSLAAPSASSALSSSGA